MASKILIITYEFPPIIGGAGVYAHDLAIGLSLNAHNVTIITYEHAKESKFLYSKLLEKYNIRVKALVPKKYFHFFQFIYSIVEELRCSNFDYIILNDGRSKRIFALFSYLFTKHIKKTICVFHGDEYSSFIKKNSFRLSILGLKRKFLKILYKQKYIVTVSKNEYDFWVKQIPELKTKIYLINHGICEDIFYKRSQSQRSDLRKKYNLSENSNIIITASRLVEKKGQDNLILALKKIKSDFVLIICGDGDYKCNLDQLVKDSFLSDKILFVGPLDRYELSNYMALSDFFVLTSRYEESFGLVYLEAAACGLPSIAGNRGGTSDAVVDQFTGYLVNPENIDEIGDRIEALLLPENRLVMGDNAESRFHEFFTSKKMSERLMKILHNEIY